MNNNVRYESEYIGLHIPCPDCGSSDALVLYADHSHCYSCYKQHWLEKETSRFKGLAEFTCAEDFYNAFQNKEELKQKKEQVTMEKEQHNSPDDLIVKQKKHEGTLFQTQVDEGIKRGPIKHRGINADTAKKFDVLLWLDDANNLKRTLFQHKNDKHEVVAQKIKTVDRKFTTIGQSKDMRFYGQHLFPAGSGLKLTITEGEEDALAVYQMNGGFPVVSLPNGAQSVKKLIEQEKDYLKSWPEIILCFDNDEEGQKAAQYFAKRFPANTKIMNLGEYKDANELLLKAANPVVEFKQKFYSAQKYSPKGVLTGQQLKEIALRDSPAPECFLYPWEGLNKLTFGWRRGELWVWTAHSKVGKTTVMKEIIHHSMNEHKNLKFGVIFLEDSLERNTKAFVATAGNKPFHIPDCDFTQEEYKAAVDSIDWDRISLIEKKALGGSLTSILDKVEEMIFANEVDMIVLDNLMALVSLSSDAYDQERQKLNELIGKLVALAETQNVHIAVVAHLNRADNIYGTGNIEKIGHGVIRLSRDKKHENRAMRDKTLVWVEHNRFCGYEEEACWLVYNKETGRLSEEPFEPEDDDDELTEKSGFNQDMPVFDNSKYGGNFG